MSGLAFGFTAPIVLTGLLALPVIWWLLRLTPPRPTSEIFPPLRILARILKKEETPHKSPWWLTLLRLVLAGLLVLAMAGPVLNPQTTLAKNGPVAILMDNGWASAPDWKERSAAAERLIADAGNSGQSVILAFTTDPANAEIGPFDPAEARDRLRAAQPHPVPVDRKVAYEHVGRVLAQAPADTLALLTDGISSPGDEPAFKAIATSGAKQLIWGQSDIADVIGLTAIDNLPDTFSATAIRPDSNSGPASYVLAARDDRGRQIAEQTLSFANGQTSAVADIDVPFELRNDFASINVTGIHEAAALRLIDDNSRRRRIALLAASEPDQAQPLLSPLYYIQRAIQPFADIIEPKSVDLDVAVPDMIAQNPAIIVLADVGTMPQAARDDLSSWVNNGGTLVRFAGPRLAASTENDNLLPVKLRQGERSLGGALSWTEPQPVAEFPPNGPFSDLTPPRDVTVTRQVLAEPDAELASRTWATLADGTPLVTGAQRGQGTLVLFHITPEATWSNLPISGSFVEMLRRIVQLSRNQGKASTAELAATATLPPYRIVTANGDLGPPPATAKPLNAKSSVSIENPPGLYGSQDGYVAHNLLARDANLTALAEPQLGLPVTVLRYAANETVDLRGPVLMTALLLLAIDTLIVFWMGGVFSRRPGRARHAAAAGTVLIAAAFLFLHLPEARASDEMPGDSEIVAAITKTRIAYVKTGKADIDSVTLAGLEGLVTFLANHTALEMGDPVGVDLADDELAFYPLIYWAIDPDSALPSEKAIARLDAYMQQGGTVLFDTRDEYSSSFSAPGSVGGSTRWLRDVLSGLNIPPLEPVPPDHVLTKAFYILNDFPGRYDGSPLWVEASLTARNTQSRPVRTGDGVSPILITGNDFAGAWAIDSAGNPLLPTVPNNPIQRMYAYRAGVNIMMYMLTGNYKSDQVHIPALLERLGQ
jgi:hypothetical protein